MNANDIYNQLAGLSGYDPYREKFEQETRYMKEMARQEALSQSALGMRNSPLAASPQPVPNPEPNKVLLLLGEDA